MSETLSKLQNLNKKCSKCPLCAFTQACSVGIENKRSFVKINPVPVVKHVGIWHCIVAPLINGITYRQTTLRKWTQSLLTNWMRRPACYLLCIRSDGTRRYGLQRRSYNGLPGLAPVQQLRQIRWIHENPVDECWSKCYSLCGMAGKTIDILCVYFCMCMLHLMCFLLINHRFISGNKKFCFWWSTLAHSCIQNLC